MAVCILFSLALVGIGVGFAPPFEPPSSSCGNFGALLVALLLIFFAKLVVFLATVYPSAAATAGDGMLSAWKPNILFTMSSADLAKKANRQIAKVASARSEFFPKSTAVEHNAKNAMQ